MERTNEIIRILMERDGMDFEEAKEVFMDVKSEMEDAIADGDYELAEEIFEGDLGLELDYVFSMLL